MIFPGSRCGKADSRGCHRGAPCGNRAWLAGASPEGRLGTNFAGRIPGDAAFHDPGAAATPVDCASGANRGFAAVRRAVPSEMPATGWGTRNPALDGCGQDEIPTYARRMSPSCNWRMSGWTGGRSCRRIALSMAPGCGYSVKKTPAFGPGPGRRALRAAAPPLTGLPPVSRGNPTD